jgi:hypothetical protein
MYGVHNPEDALYTPGGRQRSGLQPSYVIYIYGGTIYAKALVAGLGDYNGAVASTVINAAITALAGIGGGKIFIKRGTYIPAASYVQNNSIELEGEGEQTVLRLPANAGFDLIISPAQQISYYMRLSRLCLDGNGVNQVAPRSCVAWADPVYSTIESCVIKNFQGSGIASSQASIGSSNNWIRHNYFRVDDGVVGGPFINIEGWDWQIEQNIAGWVNGSYRGLFNHGGGMRIVNNQIHYASDYSIWLQDGDFSLIQGNYLGWPQLHQIYLHAVNGNVTRTQICNNVFMNTSAVGPNTADVINCHGHGGEVSQCRIIGNIARNPDVGAYRNFVRQEDTAGIDTIVDNRIADYTVPFVLLGDANKIRDNSGYNPRGNVATPWINGAGALSDIAAALDNPVNHALYTVTESPKLIILTNCAGITAVQIDGVTLTNVTTASPQIYKLGPGQTIHVEWATTTPHGEVYAE